MSAVHAEGVAQGYSSADLRAAMGAEGQIQWIRGVRVQPYRIPRCTAEGVMPMTRARGEKPSCIWITE